MTSELWPNRLTTFLLRAHMWLYMGLKLVPLSQ